MSVDPLQDIDEVDVGVDLVKNTRRDQALNLANALRTKLRSAERPVFPSHWDRAQGSLQVIRVDR